RRAWRGRAGRAARRAPRARSPPRGPPLPSRAGRRSARAPRAPARMWAPRPRPPALRAPRWGHPGPPPAFSVTLRGARVVRGPCRVRNGSVTIPPGRPRRAGPAESGGGPLSARGERARLRPHALDAGVEAAGGELDVDRLARREAARVAHDRALVAHDRVAARERRGRGERTQAAGEALELGSA